MVALPTVDIGSLSDIGRLRERNEDHFAVADLTKHLEVLQSNLDDADPRDERCGHVFLVADGMGGAKGGARASELAVRRLLNHLTEKVPWFLESENEPGSKADRSTAGAASSDEGRAGADASSLDDSIAELQEALRSCHQAIVQAAQEERGHEGMGTTLTMALVVWPDLHIAHVGDSRCYLLRGRRLEQLTTDHTLAQKMVDEGSMTEAEARNSRLSHMLTQVLGGRVEPLEPQVVHRTLQHDDLVLLTTDGVHGELSDRELEMLAIAAPDATALCREAVDAANRAGGRDNSTLIAAHFGVDPADQEPTQPIATRPRSEESPS